MSTRKGETREQYWARKYPDRSKWSYPDVDVRACVSPLDGNAVEVTIFWPTPSDCRRGEGTCVTPNQARLLAHQLLEAADAIKPAFEFVCDHAGRPMYWVPTCP
jgi:hypothetical protein